MKALSVFPSLTQLCGWGSGVESRTKKGNKKTRISNESVSYATNKNTDLLNICSLASCAFTFYLTAQLILHWHVEMLHLFVWNDILLTCDGHLYFSTERCVSGVKLVECTGGCFYHNGMNIDFFFFEYFVAFYQNRCPAFYTVTTTEMIDRTITNGIFDNWLIIDQVTGNNIWSDKASNFLGEWIYS